MSKRPPFKGRSNLQQAWILTLCAETEASRPDFEKGYDIHYTKTPQPDWKPGGGLNDLVGVWEICHGYPVDYK